MVNLNYVVLAAENVEDTNKDYWRGAAFGILSRMAE
jgi:hypothetical protein